MKWEDHVFKEISNERARTAGNKIFSTRRLGKHFNCDIQRMKNFKERLTRVYFKYFDKKLTTETYAHGDYHVCALNADT